VVHWAAALVSTGGDAGAVDAAAIDAAAIDAAAEAAGAATEAAGAATDAAGAATDAAGAATDAAGAAVGAVVADEPHAAISTATVPIAIDERRLRIVALKAPPPCLSVPRGIHDCPSPDCPRHTAFDIQPGPEMRTQDSPRLLRMRLTETSDPLPWNVDPR